MDFRSRGTPLLFFLLLSAIFPFPFSEANHLLTKKQDTSIFAQSLVSSTVFRIHGNVYPQGYYTVSLSIGNPPKFFDLDIDTGSDLTWVECDAPCKGCTKPPSLQYKPHKNLVSCASPLCAAAQSNSKQKHPCTAPNAQCDYDVEYADHGSSLGVLVQDIVPVRLTNGSLVRPLVAFGCGYDQEYHGSSTQPSTAGVLGLGNSKASILSQLQSMGLIRNVVGHCLSGKEGGFLFFGDTNIPSSGIVWTPIRQSSSEKHYNTGPADLLFNGKPTPVKGLQLIFDSGSTYTYFNSQTYKATFDLVNNDLKGKPLTRATDDPTLPICWKGAKPFKSLSDVINYFKPLTLSFTNSRNTLFHLPPQAYLIVTKKGNVCLGILDGTQTSLGNLNVIGDISFQDKIVIYDNERKQIGWGSANCDRRSK